MGRQYTVGKGTVREEAPCEGIMTEQGQHVPVFGPSWESIWGSSGLRVRGFAEAVLPCVLRPASERATAGQRRPARLTDSGANTIALTAVALRQ